MMRRLSFLVLPGARDGLGGYPVRRRRVGLGARGGFLAASFLWGGLALAWWALA